MDLPLTSPNRLHVVRFTVISTPVTYERLDAFLTDFQARSTSAQGGNTAVTVQLQKLMDALKEDRKQKRVKDFIFTVA